MISKETSQASFTNHFIKAAIARGIAIIAMPSTGIVRGLLLFWPRRRREMTVGDQRWGSRPCREDRALWERTQSATRTPLPEGDDGDGSGGLMGQSRGSVAIDRGSGGAGTGARAWSLSMKPLAPKMFLRTSGPIRPPRFKNSPSTIPEGPSATRLHAAQKSSH